MAGSDKAERDRQSRMFSEPISGARRRAKGYDLTGARPKGMDATSFDSYQREQAAAGKGIKNLFFDRASRGPNHFITGVPHDDRR